MCTFSSRFFSASAPSSSCLCLAMMLSMCCPLSRRLADASHASLELFHSRHHPTTRQQRRRLANALHAPLRFIFTTRRPQPRGNRLTWEELSTCTILQFCYFFHSMEAPTRAAPNRQKVQMLRVYQLFETPPRPVLPTPEDTTRT